MAFHQKPFKERLETMGDPAEQAFEQWAEQNNIPCVRRGFNRPPFSAAAFKKIPKTLRLESDYLAEIDKNVYYIECKGFGRGSLKIKKETLNQWYAEELRGLMTKVFIFDQVNNENFLIDYRPMFEQAQDKEVKKFENDHKEYVEFTRKEIWNLAGAHA
jgi:uncharacterized protein YbcI